MITGADPVAPYCDFRSALGSPFAGRLLAAIPPPATLLEGRDVYKRQGLGYALTFDGLINTEGSDLCFRPLAPQLEAPGSIVWKKYQVFSKPAAAFLQCLRGML